MKNSYQSRTETDKIGLVILLRNFYQTSFVSHFLRGIFYNYAINVCTDSICITPVQYNDTFSENLFLQLS